MDFDFRHVNFYREIHKKQVIVYDEALITVSDYYFLFYSTIISQSLDGSFNKQIHAYIHGKMKSPFYTYDFKNNHLISKISTLSNQEIPRAIFMIESAIGLEAQIYMAKFN